MRIALHFIGYGSVATDIVTYIADQEHGFPVPGLATLSFRPSYICTAKVFRVNYLLRIKSVKGFWEM